MLLLEAVLVGGAQRHHRRHVHLVEGGELGGGVLGFLQAQGDGLAQAGHRHAFFAGFLVTRPGRSGGGNRGRGAGGKRAQHVALGDAAILAGAGNRRSGNAGFGGNALGRRHGGNVRLGGNRRRGRRRLGRFRLGGRRGLGGRRRTGLCSSLAFGNGAQQRADRNGGAGLGRDGFDRAIGGRGDFHRHLVGLQFQQGLVAFHRVAFLLEPFGDGGLGYGFAHRGHFDFDGHDRPSWGGLRLKEKVHR